MISVIDGGMGNIGSIMNMLQRLGVEARLASSPEQVIGADKLILPGVGAFDYGMSRLQDQGLVSALNTAVLERKVPILGVCLGLQLFSRRSEEGKQPGLGWLAADTVRFRFPVSEREPKVPHMGCVFGIPKRSLNMGGKWATRRLIFLRSYPPANGNGLHKMRP